jgi:hypothetical protein
MKKLILSTIIGLLVLFMPVACLAQGGVVTGATKAGANAACEGANAATGGGNCTTTQGNVGNLLAKVVNLLSWIVGVVSVLMIIFGGLWIITAAGDSQKVGRGRSTIIYAIIGLVIVAMAQIIVRFVLYNLNKV